MREQNILSVSQVNEYVKGMMEQDPLLNFVCIRGEISNYKVYPSGHHYFSLKDAGGSLRCVMFKGSAIRLRFRPENGMKILVFGRISVFPRDGVYQLYCEQLSVEGAGDLFVAFEQLKDKLHAEGLFDPEHKKPIPQYPKNIAIITSSAGAAIHDMLRILGRRYPLAKVLLLPVRVQGVEAPAEIVDAIRYVNQYALADVIITGRGGGSAEDLWAFNDETLAHAIYDSQIPVISAVGHEPDVTISDYVADLRAATPSHAAELAVPDKTELIDRLNIVQSQMCQCVQKQIKLSHQRLTALENSRVMKNPINYIQDRRLLLDHRQKELAATMQCHLAADKQSFTRLTAALDAMSPLKVLSRGYSVTKLHGEILTDTRSVQIGDSVTVMLHAGQIGAEVTQIIGGTDEDNQ